MQSYFSIVTKLELVRYEMQERTAEATRSFCKYN